MTFKKTILFFIAFIFICSTFAKTHPVDSNKKDAAKNQTVYIDSLNNSPIGFPVIGFFNDTLFLFIQDPAASLLRKELLQ